MSFQTTFICELEYWKYVFLIWIWQFSYANQVTRRNNLAVLNDVTDLESERTYIMFDAIYLWIEYNFHPAEHKITTSNVPGCGSCANKSQTTYEKIYHSSWFNTASLYRVLCLGIYLYFSFLETIIWIKQSHVFKWLVSTFVYAVL